jgi:hypothetical protein
LSVSPICIGLVRSPDAISTAFDLGINFFFFSGDMHWAAYEATRQGLRDLCARGPSVRRQIVVATVCYLTQPEFCRIPFMDALDAVPGLDRLDVAVAGGVYASEFATRLAVYEGHRGRAFLGVQAIGASFHDRGAALVAIRHQQVDIAFVRYNPLHSGARWDLFPQVGLRSAPLLFSFNSTHGYPGEKRWAEFDLPPDAWRPRATDYYRFALTRPEVDGLLCAPSTANQVAQLVESLAQGPLGAEEESWLADLARSQGPARSWRTAGPVGPAGARPDPPQEEAT